MCSLSCGYNRFPLVEHDPRYTLIVRDILYWETARSLWTQYLKAIPGKEEKVKRAIRGILADYEKEERDIIYLESKNHCVLVHLDGIRQTPEGSPSFYATLDEAEHEFASSAFLRIHKSYLINGDHILQMSNYKVLLDTGMTLKGSRKYFSKAKLEFYVRCANSDPRIAFDRLYDLIDEAAGHGFLVRGTSFDHCSGNTLKDRIGLRTMLDAVENGRIEAVMVRDLEQISRNSYILVGVIEILRQNDVYLTSLRKMPARNTYRNCRSLTKKHSKKPMTLSADAAQRQRKTGESPIPARTRRCWRVLSTAPTAERRCPALCTQTATNWRMVVSAKKSSPSITAFSAANATKAAETVMGKHCTLPREWMPSS